MLESGAYIMTAIIDYIIGVLFGVLAAWNKKVFFWVVLGWFTVLLILSMISWKELSESMNLLQILVGTISTLLGFWSGMKFYEAIIGIKE